MFFKRSKRKYRNYSEYEDLDEDYYDEDLDEDYYDEDLDEDYYDEEDYDDLDEDYDEDDPKYYKKGKSRGRKPVKKKNSRFKRIFLLMILATFIYFMYGFFKPYLGERYWCVAVFGLDSRDGNLEKNALSDSIIIAEIDRRSGDIKLVSVYRDSFLKVGDDKYHKINEAYFLGGHKQAVKALEENLDIDIDDYVSFNWGAVASGINALGGVDLEITDREFSQINGYITETVNSTGIGSHQLKKAGYQHLDGVQAVAYSRLRKMDTDFNRTARQRKVISLSMDKAKNADKTVLMKTAKTVFNEINTSIGLSDILSLLSNIKSYNIVDSTGYPEMRVSKKVGKMECVIPATLESNNKKLHEVLFGEENYVPSKKVMEISNHIKKLTGVGETVKEAAPVKLGGSKKKNSSKEKHIVKPSTDLEESKASKSSEDEMDNEESKEESIEENEILDEEMEDPEISEGPIESESDDYSDDYIEDENPEYNYDETSASKELEDDKDHNGPGFDLKEEIKHEEPGMPSNTDELQGPGIME